MAQQKKVTSVCQQSSKTVGIKKDISVNQVTHYCHFIAGGNLFRFAGGLFSLRDWGCLSVCPSVRQSVSLFVRTNVNLYAKFLIF